MSQGIQMTCYCVNAKKELAEQPIKYQKKNEALKQPLRYNSF